MLQEQKKGTHTRAIRRVCHWGSYHILTSSVIYQWTDARQDGIYLFYTTKGRKSSQWRPPLGHRQRPIETRVEFSFVAQIYKFHQTIYSSVDLSSSLIAQLQEHCIGSPSSSNSPFRPTFSLLLKVALTNLLGTYTLKFYYLNPFLSATSQAICHNSRILELRILESTEAEK